MSNKNTEADTRAELIDPKLKEAGWGVVPGSKILRERNVCQITAGRYEVTSFSVVAYLRRLWQVALNTRLPQQK